MEESYCSSCGSHLSTSREAERPFNANWQSNHYECVCCYSHGDDVTGSQSESKQIKTRNNSTGKRMTEK